LGKEDASILGAYWLVLEAIAILRTQEAVRLECARRSAHAWKLRRSKCPVRSWLQAANVAPHSAVFILNSDEFPSYLRQVWPLQLGKFLDRCQQCRNKDALQLHQSIDKEIEPLEGLLSMRKAEQIGGRFATEAHKELLMELLHDDDRLQKRQICTLQAKLVMMIDSILVERDGQLLASCRDVEDCLKLIQAGIVLGKDRCSGLGG